MIVDVEPYVFAPGSGGLGAHYEYEEEVLEWVREMRWVVTVSGRNLGDDFREWLWQLAASHRGVIWNPYQRGEGALEHVNAYDAHEAALGMARATRPIDCDWDDSARDLIRRDEAAEAELARLRDEATVLLGRAVSSPDDKALNDAYAAQWHRARAAADAMDAVVYGADLDTVTRSDLRLSRDAALHLSLAAGDDAEADEPIRFSLFEEPVRGRRDSAWCRQYYTA